VLGKLTAEDASILRRDWEGRRYREDLEGYFRTVIQNYDSSCLRDVTSGELQAYACMQFNGSIAMLYVKPEHRNDDSFKIVLSALARLRLSNGDVAYGFIPTNDSDLVNQMRAMDFDWVPRGDMVWMNFEPLTVNATNVFPPQTSASNDVDETSSFDCVCSDHAKQTVKNSIQICRMAFDSQMKTVDATPTSKDISTLVSISSTS